MSYHFAQFFSLDSPKAIKARSFGYHVTFSFAGDNEADCREAIAAGGNVAVCFEGAFPQSWFGREVIDGDKSDLRHLDPRNVVVGLSPKGSKAKRVALGFVVRP